MNYTNEEWTISELIGVYEERRLFLNPPYQRNPVWSLKAQQILIDTIVLGQPMPNFFLLKKSDNTYEVVDGQQRIRTILGFWKNLIPDLNNKTLERMLEASPYPQKLKALFYEYRISVCILSDLIETENIEQFYSKVNSTGLRLNRPELKKAEYFSTNFLRLLQQLTELPELQSLKLFSSLTSSRLNDLDFVSELVALLKYGISDKKEKVDELYEDDISVNEFDILFNSFKMVINVMNEFDNIIPIRRTRYKQKNDFYTLFFFVNKYITLPIDDLKYLYMVLTKIGPFIRPSQEECLPLKQYALHCVTQSNSKHARFERSYFFEELLLNPMDTPNEVQTHVISFFNMQEPCLKAVDKFFSLNCDSIVYHEQTEFNF